MRQTHLIVVRKTKTKPKKKKIDWESVGDFLIVLVFVLLTFLAAHFLG